MDSFTLASVLVGVGWFLLWLRSKSSIPYPPGPSGNLLFGSALELRKSKAFWLNFAQWSKEYGPIMTIRMAYRSLFVVDDPNVAVSLFEKKASQYSDRYVSELAKLGEWDHDIIFIEYGPTLKHYRTLLQKALNNRVALDYLPLQEHEVKRLLRRLYETPEQFMEHVHLMAGSVAIRMVYGYKVDSAQDPLVQSAEKVMSIFSDIMTPGRWMIEVFPFLRYLPTWFPGTAFHQMVASSRPVLHSFAENTFTFVKSESLKGTAEPSFTSKLLESDSSEGITSEEELHVKRIASSLYGAASDTTVSAVKSFFLAMTLYPDVQAKAQSEISTYFDQTQLSKGRFVTMDDRDKLPYTSALVRELLRWHPVANLTAHRSCGKDDNSVVVGENVYRIPAYSIVIVNMWSMLHNPSVYPDPEKFIPERHLVENPPPAPELYAFGFGRRRMCPGTHVAQQSMWLSISNILANFTITKAKDENGAEIIPKEEYTNEVISHPAPFKCKITPREGWEKWSTETGVPAHGSDTD
ncbi:cytochrome P450 [Rhizoctonia solani]|uniref:Cytochrome P450 n=1 Tax=Rhizoctonia solani TaxID=456999 RepID=A0A8H7H0H3_9AGAM|nr:cytochrome P450 [Rhizoctonia solani]